MKTVIFILALTAIAAPVFTAPGDAVTCVSAPAGCNTCLEGATSMCFDCKAGYYLSYTSISTGTCTRCAAGKGAPAGAAVAGTTANAARPATATACTADCDATCAECLLAATASSCTRCAAHKWAASFASGTGTCSGTCATAGKTRDVATADLTAVETDAGVCTVNCNASCAECMGSAVGKCTKCAAGYFLSAKAAATDLMGTCSWCTGGMGKDADGTAIASTTAATTSAVACTTKCTGTDCGACSMAKPAECLACATDFTFDATAKTCKKTAAAASSATLIQALCGATVAAYALF